MCYIGRVCYLCFGVLEYVLGVDYAYLLILVYCYVVLTRHVTFICAEWVLITCFKVSVTTQGDGLYFSLYGLKVLVFMLVFVI